MVNDIENIELKDVSINNFKEVEINKIFSTSQKRLKSFFELIIKYNKQSKSMFFYQFYCNENNLNYGSKEKKKIQNNLGVKKSRLNTHLQKYNYVINRDYEIKELENLSFESLLTEATKRVNLITIKNIKIFDSYNRDEKKLLFNQNNLNNLIGLLKQGGSVEIISTFNNKDMAKFNQDLLDYNKDINNDLTIKYLRKPLMESFPLLFILITDTNNNNHILYYEHITRWSVLAKVETNNLFPLRFYGLLESRFNHYFNSQELENNCEVVTVNHKTFSKDFFTGIKTISAEMNELLNKTSITEESIKKKISQLILRLTKLKISSPNMNHSNTIMFHYIKLLETMLIIINTNKLPNSKRVLDILSTFNVINKMNTKLSDEALKNELQIKDVSFNNIDIKQLRIDLCTFEITSDNTIIDIFDDFSINTPKLIKNSLNEILLNNQSLSTFISKIVLINNILLEDEIHLMKLIFRIFIFKYYKIKLDTNIILVEQKDFTKLKSLSFYDSEFKDYLFKYISI